MSLKIQWSHSFTLVYCGGIACASCDGCDVLGSTCAYYTSSWLGWQWLAWVFANATLFICTWNYYAAVPLKNKQAATANWRQSITTVFDCWFLYFIEFIYVLTRKIVVKSPPTFRFLKSRNLWWWKCENSCFIYKLTVLPILQLGFSCLLNPYKDGLSPRSPFPICSHARSLPCNRQLLQIRMRKILWPFIGMLFRWRWQNLSSLHDDYQYPFQSRFRRTGKEHSFDQFRLAEVPLDSWPVLIIYILIDKNNDQIKRDGRKYKKNTLTRLCPREGLLYVRSS